MKKILNLIKRNLKKVLFITIPLLFFIIFILIVNKVDKKNNELITENAKFYQYFVGKRYEYDGVLTLNKRSEVTDIKLDGHKLEYFSSPIYYQDSKELFLPEGMSIIDYSNGFYQNYINYFTKISMVGTKPVLSFGDKSLLANDMFLFDGEDLFLFLEDVQITYNDQLIKIPAMSYVIVRYRESLEIYNYNEKEGMVININDTDIYAYGKNLVLNLSLDSLQVNGQYLLLYRKVDDLPKLSGW